MLAHEHPHTHAVMTYTILAWALYVDHFWIALSERADHALNDQRYTTIIISAG